jgi:hypothetical protein
MAEGELDAEDCKAESIARGDGHGVAKESWLFSHWSQDGCRDTGRDKVGLTGLLRGDARGGEEGELDTVEGMRAGGGFEGGGGRGADGVRDNGG